MIITDTARHRHSVLPQATRCRAAMAQYRRSLRTVLLALTAAAFTFPAFAEDGSTIIKKQRDKDITVIVIDDHDRGRKRVVEDRPREPGSQGLIKRRKEKLRIRYEDDRHERRGKSRSTDGRDPNAIITRSDDGTYVRIPGRTGDDGRQDKTGPKIIVIDRSTGACKGSGVCVIRP